MDTTTPTLSKEEDIVYLLGGGLARQTIFGASLGCLNSRGIRVLTADTRRCGQLIAENVLDGRAP